MRFLITAGGTREPIDPVRFIANASSGKMGYALAREARRIGHDVVLISGPTYLRAPRDVTFMSIQTAQDMFQAVQDSYSDCEAMIMAAAVADYRVVIPAERKLKKEKRALTLNLTPTVDILQWAGTEKRRRLEEASGQAPFLVGFALEDEDVRRRAEDKLDHKHLDMIIANRPAAIGADASELHIKRPGHPWQELPLAPKTTQARRIIRIITPLLVHRSG
jgi:phosphopantothenoylcysteine decarboxylase/phosphopantothenate--cysteine ligase